MKRNTTTNFTEIVRGLTDLSETEFKMAIKCARQQRKATKTLENELIRQKRSKLPTKSRAKGSIEGMNYEPVAA